MSNTITWSIANLEATNDTNKGVVVAHWRAVCTNNDASNIESASGYGTCSFTPDPTAEGFTPYADLTEAQVIGWVKDSLGADLVANIETNLNAEVEKNKNAPVITGTPWG